jgi:uncharacterized protein YwgA
MGGDARMEKYARLLAVFERCGRIHSRIKAQKIFYILKSLGFPVTERYKFRDYGPYSEELASELRSSVNALFLNETRVERKEDWGDETISYERFDLSIAPKGKEFLKVYLEQNPGLAHVTNQMADVAETLVRDSPQSLELIATLMFLQDQNVRSDLIIPILKDQKPQFTDSEIARALETIEELRKQYTHHV